MRREDSKAAQYAEQQAGGLFLETSRFGDDEDRIIQEPMERPFTHAADTNVSINRTRFRWIIDVFGADMAAVPRIKAGVTAAGHDAEAYGLFGPNGSFNA